MKSKFKTNFKTAVKSSVEKQRRDESGNSYLRPPRGMGFFKPKEGKVNIDIIPYIVKMDKHPDNENGVAEKGTLWYRLPIKIHRNIGSGNEVHICPTTFGKPCPICEYRAKRMQEGAEKEELDSLRASKRNLYLVIPKTKGYEKELQIFDISDYCFQQLLNQEIDENEDYANFPSLEDGFTLKVRFEENSAGKNNKYLAANRIDFEERDEAYDESILEEVPCLDDIVVVLSYAELKAKFFDIDDETEDDDDDEPKKPQRSKKKIEAEDDDDDEEPAPKKKKPVAKDDDDDDEEPAPSKKKVVKDEDEDDDEEPAPKKKPAKKSTKPEPEEEDEDDDEEEPAPKKKKPAAEEKSSKNKCPHGYKFGKDCDKYEECDDCVKWDECSDAN